MVDVQRVKLPGVGVLHTFLTEDGGKVGVIAHRSGHNDLITFEDQEEGPDTSKVSLRLNEDEAHTLAELLGGTQIIESLTALDEIPGLTIDWFAVDDNDFIAGRQLGTPAGYGFDDLTVVAVVSGDTTSPAPAPDYVVSAGDTLVVAGSPDNVSRAFHFYRTGNHNAVRSALGSARGG
jgi:K+:H+ antiporter subunit KhtT